MTNNAGPTQGEQMEQKCQRPGCTRTLRSNNRKGVCADRNVCEGTDDGAPRPPPATKPVAVAKAPDAELSLEKFRLVATTLGFNADEILAQLAAGWLESLGEQLREANK